MIKLIILTYLLIGCISTIAFCINNFIIFNTRGLIELTMAYCEEENKQSFIKYLLIGTGLTIVIWPIMMVSIIIEFVKASKKEGES